MEHDKLPDSDSDCENDAQAPVTASQSVSIHGAAAAGGAPGLATSGAHGGVVFECEEMGDSSTGSDSESERAAPAAAASRTGAAVQSGQCYTPSDGDGAHIQFEQEEISSGDDEGGDDASVSAAAAPTPTAPPQPAVLRQGDLVGKQRLQLGDRHPGASSAFAAYVPSATLSHKPAPT
eukprot:jgi/Mesen1/6377/ME000329S05533